MAKNWAICIGINEYYNLKPLNYAQQDAEAMHDFCLNEASFEQVYYFANSAGTLPTPPKINLYNLDHLPIERKLTCDKNQHRLKIAIWNPLNLKPI